MSIHRLKSWLFALGASFLLVAPAQAQVPPFFGGIADDVQIFSQPNLNSFMSREIETDGWFGGIESFLLTVSGPTQVDVGVDGGFRQVYVNNSAPVSPLGAGITAPVNNVGTIFAQQRNTDSTGFIRASISGGGRFDLGFVEDGVGWLVSAFNPITNTQDFTAYDAAVVFNEPTVRVYNAFASQSAAAGAATSVTATNPIFIDMPILFGFIDQTGGGTAGNRNNPDGFADDINRNNLYGPDGRDRGVSNGTTITNPSQLDGIPDREGGVDPAPIANPGGPAAGITSQPVDYGDAVPLPVIFTELFMRQRTTTGSIEANYLRRFDAFTRRGWTVDVIGGVRFLDLSDQFLVRGVGGILADSYWDTRAANRIVGGQLGMRIQRKRDRWSLGVETRGVAASNFQTVRQDGEIGSLLTQILPNNGIAAANGGGVATQPFNPGGGPNARRLNQPLNLQPTAFNSSANMVTFAPMFELRSNLAYQVFNNVSVNAGYTALYAQNLARSSSMVDYTLPRMGIVATNNNQPIFMSGFNIGVTINR